MAASSNKPSAYAKRNNASTAVPLGRNHQLSTGTTIRAITGGVQRWIRTPTLIPSLTYLRSPRNVGGRGEKSKKLIETLAKIGVKSSRRSDEKRVVPIPQCPNLLLQYFGDIGIEATPNSEEKDDADDEEEDYEDEEDEAEDDVDDPQPMPRTLAVLSHKSTPQPPSAAAEDDSVTEYESDLEDSSHPARPSPSKRAATQYPTAVKPPPSKKPRLANPDDSVTEPEDEEPHWIHSQVKASTSVPSKVAQQSDSETEPESDPEWLMEVNRGARFVVQRTSLTRA
ncbi:hypothetical protein BV20DRAFT_222473 [Pilatotrama ljubarskyi]|nr:hypothetical protein BV20DRAFT_222473 [Pilatotrama ljubarskyi]